VDVDGIVPERLRLLRNEVGYLKTERDNVHSFQTYRENIRLKKAVERSLHISVEICLDIGRRIIALEGFRYPENNQDVFQILAEENILSPGLSPTLREMGRFRNLIVHYYAQIDNARVYSIPKKRLSDFDAFAEAIRAYLEEE